MVITRFYSTDALDQRQIDHLLEKIKSVNGNVSSLLVERCYHVESTKPIDSLSNEDNILRWLLKQPLSTMASLTKESTLTSNDTSLLIEIGPRFNFSTPYSTNCVNICQNVGMNHITRLEASHRYLIRFADDSLTYDINHFVNILSDRMTECLYTADNLPIDSFNEQLPTKPQPWYYVPVLEHGVEALQKVNVELGLAFSDWDLKYYLNLFTKLLKRNPTNVELFDCAQSNSEHSRHWFFRGSMIIDGIEQQKSLIRMIIDTQKHTNANNTIKFKDNSSAIKGFQYKTIKLGSVNGPKPIIIQEVDSDLIFTAETHNMPTAVAPFSGATTGTGGRLRDVQGVGRGGLPIAGTAGYCVGCLNIPGYKLPYESDSFEYPNSFAKPLKILIDASNGASDYGNKFGEPVITGFVYSYGLRNITGSRDEYVKPIMFSGGLGTMPANMREKLEPQRGMLLAKIGGPVYRIGVGGGAASSVEIQGSNASDLDFNAVQRGDAEMENKLNRVVRACLDLGDNNPILAIHDQGAGGNGNVLKELVEPGFAGAIIFSKEFKLGDPTINALELWGAEYQENNAILCKQEHRDLLESICLRERCPISFVGIVTGDGRVTLVEDNANFEKALENYENKAYGPAPFDLELKYVLGDMPQRKYHLERTSLSLEHLKFDAIIDIESSLERVFSLVAVGSKRFLTNKVDRCVTGLIAQQQCVGPLHAPLADYGLTTVSHFSKHGIATSIGTQPIKGLLSPAAMARLSVAEALSNLVFVKISELGDIKCSGNWMWAAKLPGEGAKMYDACQEMCAIMKELNIAVDGGKDSLSMAAKVNTETIKSPGTLVISMYAPCPDVTFKVTPDLKGSRYAGKDTALLWINIEGKFRLGGSSLAQAYGQQGLDSPDIEQTSILKNAFIVTQQLLKNKSLLAGHDISDGGLITCLIEMSIGGLCGFNVDLTTIINNFKSDAFDAAALTIESPEIALLYAEECGWVLELDVSQLEQVRAAYVKAGVPCYYLGKTNGYGLASTINISSNGKKILEKKLRSLYQQWERTSFELEKLQANVGCAIEEYETLNYRLGPTYNCNLNIEKELTLRRLVTPMRVAVLREEGVNSDREMMACLFKSYFEVYDLTMSDLLDGRTQLACFRGVVFPGGFSYADTLGSAKGWAANIMCSEILAPQFKKFQERTDTFSLGICNGCQLMSLLGWVGNTETIKQNTIDQLPDVALLPNQSERFECRWSTVRIADSKALMLRGLAGTVLGCWVAHGEGRFTFRKSNILNSLKENKLIAMNYVDDQNQPTEIYPMNPNGSIEGIAGLCSPDGRHLALMPHPERCTEMFQWPYASPGFNPSNCETSPWQLIFHNAYKWCSMQ